MCFVLGIGNIELTIHFTCRFKLKVNLNLRPKRNFTFEAEYTLRCSLLVLVVYVIYGLVLDGLYFWTVGAIYRIYFKTMHS